MLYADDEPIATKIERIATTVYGADGIELAPAARDAIARYEKQGLAHLPICMAKTHLSLSHDPTLRNRPIGVHRADPRHPRLLRGRDARAALR